MIYANFNNETVENFYLLYMFKKNFNIPNKIPMKNAVYNTLANIYSI